MNEGTLKLISQTSIAVLVLGVLVWALHTWNLERERQAAVQEQQQASVIEIMTNALFEAREDRRTLTQRIGDLSEQMISENETDKRIIELLQSNLQQITELREDLGYIGDDVRSQTKSIQRGLKIEPRK